MKEYLDLLPESKKKEISQVRRARKIVVQEISFLFPVCLFIAFLLGINFIVKIQSDGVAAVYENEQKKEGNEELRVYESRFSEANDKLAVLMTTQEFHLNWSKVLSQIESLSPADIYLISISTKDYKVLLTGKAKTREALLSFQEALKNSDCFSGVNVPFSNLVSEKDVDFQVDLLVNEKCLKD